MMNNRIRRPMSSPDPEIAERIEVVRRIRRDKEWTQIGDRWIARVSDASGLLGWYEVRELSAHDSSRYFIAGAPAGARKWETLKVERWPCRAIDGHLHVVGSGVVLSFEKAKRIAERCWETGMWLAYE
jgi:hypothetical protein